MRSFTVATIVAAALGSACQRDGGPEQAPKTVVVDAASDLQALNPLIDTDANTHEVLLHVLFVPLIRLDDSLHYKPALAASWDWSGDSVLTMSLRRDVRWHDGRTTSAHDVAFTFNRIKDEATGFPAPEHFEGWDSVLVVDSFTIRFSLRPQSDPLIGWALVPIVPMHALDSIAPGRLREAAFNREPIGNGPFKFGGHAGNQWTFVANDDFPASLGGRPQIDRLIWRIVPDNAAQITDLKTGAADIILSPRAEQARELDESPHTRVAVTPSRRYLLIGWNTRRPQLRDARVRRALAMALDRGEMLQLLRGGYGEVAATPVAPFQWMYDSSVAPLPFDTVAAKALLDSAGVRLPISFELKIPANNQFNSDVAEMIRAQLARIGVRVTTRPTEFATLIDDISSPARRFDAVLMGFESDHRPDFRELFHSRHANGPMQMASYRDLQMDSLLDAIARTTDADAARPLWSGVQRKLRDDQPWTVLWFAPSIFAMRENLRGVDADIRGLLVNVTRWTRD